MIVLLMMLLLLIYAIVDVAFGGDTPVDNSLVDNVVKELQYYEVFILSVHRWSRLPSRLTFTTRSWDFPMVTTPSLENEASS